MNNTLLNMISNHKLSFPKAMAQNADVSDDELNALAVSLGVTLDVQYTQFVRIFGGGIVGMFSIYGLRRAEFMDSKLWSCEQVTKFKRASALSLGYNTISNGYAISDDYTADAIVMITDMPFVFFYDMLNNKLIQITKCFDDYLLFSLTSDLRFLTDFGAGWVSSSGGQPSNPIG